MSKSTILSGQTTTPNVSLSSIDGEDDEDGVNGDNDDDDENDNPAAAANDTFLLPLSSSVGLERWQKKKKRMMKEWGDPNAKNSARSRRRERRHQTSVTPPCWRGQRRCPAGAVVTPTGRCMASNTGSAQRSWARRRSRWLTRRKLRSAK